MDQHKDEFPDHEQVWEVDGVFIPVVLSREHDLHDAFEKASDFLHSLNISLKMVDVRDHSGATTRIQPEPMKQRNRTDGNTRSGIWQINTPDMNARLREFPHYSQDIHGPHYGVYVQVEVDGIEKYRQATAEETATVAAIVATADSHWRNHILEASNPKQSKGLGRLILKKLFGSRRNDDYTI